VFERNTNEIIHLELALSNLYVGYSNFDFFFKSFFVTVKCYFHFPLSKRIFQSRAFKHGTTNLISSKLNKNVALSAPQS